jgi:hypothetical protein
LAAMGVGINATVAFSVKAITPEVNALISLEGGILSATEMQFLRRSAFYDPNKFTCPSLFIYAPHPSIQPKTVEELKYADKYFIHFQKMSEYYFLDYGMLDQFIPGIIGPPPGDVKKGFELAARYVLQFLKFALNGDKQAIDQLMSAPVDTTYSSAVIKSHVPALPPMLSLVQMQNLITREGIAAFKDIYEKFKKIDTQSFTQQYLTNLFNWLAYKRDPDFNKRKVVAEVLVELFPYSTRAHFALANVHFQMNSKENAASHYEQALKLLPTDPDIELTSAVKERIRTVSEGNLKKIK